MSEYGMRYLWKTPATLSSILKKHYTRLRGKVEMLTLPLRRMCTTSRACTRTGAAHAHTSRHRRKKTQGQHTIVFLLLLTYISHLYLGDVISNNYCWPLPVPCGACLWASRDNSRSQWRGAALGGSESVSRDGGGGGGVEDLKLASYGPGNSS